MMKRLTHTAFLVILAATAGCGGADASDPEAEIRAWIDAMETHAEAKERRDIVDNISDVYADGRGNRRDDINNILRVYFLRQNSIALLTSIDEIRLLGDDAAEVSLTVGMAGTQNSGLGFSADRYDFELELENDGDNWRLVSARWGEAGSQLN